MKYKRRFCMAGLWLWRIDHSRLFMNFFSVTSASGGVCNRVVTWLLIYLLACLAGD